MASEVSLSDERQTGGSEGRAADGDALRQAAGLHARGELCQNFENTPSPEVGRPRRRTARATTRPSEVSLLMER